ncbi:GNAT family N-acetyltransferase [Nocardioides luteus]|uniref:GNAT family N-acetyltransferase n=1 Tax=Nocardioides luteus TaxID=1844 RepID=UPI00166B1FC1
MTRVAAAETHPLRALVLHGGASHDDAKVEGEDRPGVATFAAKASDGEVVGCVGLFPDPGGGWRIRRLATAGEWRGRGVGTAVVTAALEHAAEHGGRARSAGRCSRRQVEVDVRVRIGRVGS